MKNGRNPRRRKVTWLGTVKTRLAMARNGSAVQANRATLTARRKEAPNHTPVSERCPMQKKCGKFMADWRDAQGKRHRKAFASKPAALRFAGKQRRESQAKKLRASAALRTSAVRGAKAAPIPTTAGRRSTSRRSPATS